jgi:hypothetical protein
MGKKSRPNSTGKARAAAIRAEIDKLAGATKPAEDSTDPAKAAADAPANPRDFIQKWMAEHDKKSDRK